MDKINFQDSFLFFDNVSEFKRNIRLNDIHENIKITTNLKELTFPNKNAYVLLFKKTFIKEKRIIVWLNNESKQSIELEHVIKRKLYKNNYFNNLLQGIKNRFDSYKENSFSKEVDYLLKSNGINIKISNFNFYCYVISNRIQVDFKSNILCKLSFKIMFIVNKKLIK